MARVLLFGGTTEGRILAEFCVESGIPVTVSVATPDGAALLPVGVKVFCGRMEMTQMRGILASGAYSCVIDATHPYATEVTANLRAVCEELRFPYTRLIRESGDIQGKIVPDIDSLIELLNTREDTILSTLGSKSLAALTRVRDFRERLWVRVLPSVETAMLCEKLGFASDHVIAETPPFSVEQNLTHLRQSGATVLVTKESGITGGYPEKCEAAKISGTALITLYRPKEYGATLQQVKILLKEGFG